MEDALLLGPRLGLGVQVGPTGSHFLLESIEIQAHGVSLVSQ
jgi:hypothetical protein